jgi:hypothetical protein
MRRFIGEERETVAGQQKPNIVTIMADDAGTGT